MSKQNHFFTIVFITVLFISHICFNVEGATVTELLAIDKGGVGFGGGGPPGPPPGGGGGGGGSTDSTILDWVKVTYPDDVTSCKQVTFTNGSGYPVS